VQPPGVAVDDEETSVGLTQQAQPQIGGPEIRAVVELDEGLDEAAWRALFSKSPA
jgi:hypothetical protein